MSMNRCYSDLVKYSTFEDRFNYLKLNGEFTTPEERRIKQLFYRSPEWRLVRDNIIIRDNGCDLGIKGHDIPRGRGTKIFVHHMNPITAQDVLSNDSKLLDPENLITVSFNTHQAITYGDDALLIIAPLERSPNDTCPWKH